MWEYATKMASQENTNVTEVLQKKAQILQEKNDLVAAAETYIEVGDFQQAIHMFGQNRSHDKIIELARSLNKMETKALAQCVAHFRKNRQLDNAAEILTKMGDIRGLIDLRVEMQEFEEAFRLAETYPDLREHIYLPYAHHLALRDQFLDAQLYFRKAGRLDLALDVMQKLAENAVEEDRFHDAGFYYYTISREYLNGIPGEKDFKELTATEQSYVEQFQKCQQLADTYFAYHVLFRFVHEPFTSHLPESIFHMARVLLHQSLETDNQMPRRVMVSVVLYALAKQSRSLGAFKLARYAYDRLLQQFKLPASWRSSAESGWIAVRAKPFSDPDEIAPICYQCSNMNPLLQLPRVKREDGTTTDEPYNPNQCVSCKAPFVRSTYTFENIPLVEFTVSSDIDPYEAKKLIQREPSVQNLAEKDRWQALDDGKTQQLTLHDSAPLVDRTATKRVIRGGIPELGRGELAELRSSDVFVVDYGKRSIPPLFYQNVLPDVPVIMCQECFRFFHTDDYEFLVLQNSSCPFCRHCISEDSLLR